MLINKLELSYIYVYYYTYYTSFNHIVIAHSHEEQIARYAPLNIPYSNVAITLST